MCRHLPTGCVLAAGTGVSVCPYANVPAALTGVCMARVPVTGTGDRTIKIIQIMATLT